MAFLIYELKHMNPAAQKVQDALKARGFSNPVVELPDSTRSAAEAARAIGCEVSQIAKSLVFRAKLSGKPILVIASGANRVNENRLAELVGEAIEKADADFVKQHTGFVIGGVPPLGHNEKLEVYIDEDLLRFEEIWAAAGTPHTVFKLMPSELVEMAETQVVNIK